MERVVLYTSSPLCRTKTACLSLRLCQAAMETSTTGRWLTKQRVLVEERVCWLSVRSSWTSKRQAGVTGAGAAWYLRASASWFAFVQDRYAASATTETVPGSDSKPVRLGSWLASQRCLARDG
jgi:hypothetical protein